MKSLSYARLLLNRVKSGHPYSIQTITHCLRVTGDIR